MPARNKPLDLQVSRGMGARFVVQFPAGFDLSAARALIRINASTGGTFWEADQSLSFITIDDSTDQISFVIQSNSLDLFGTKYEDIATVGDHDFRIDLTGSGTAAEPDWRLQGNWGVDAREGEQGDCQPGTVNVRFDDLTIQLRFTGALEITGGTTGGLQAVVDDPAPVLGGDLKTAGSAIIVGPDTVVESGRIDDLGGIRVRGTDTAAGSLALTQAIASGIEASIVLDFTGLLQFRGQVPARFAQKVFFDALGIELNNAPIILDNAGPVGELRAGTATDLSLTAFTNKTITLTSDNQLRFDGQIRADTTGLFRQTGGDFEIVSIAALLLTGGATHKWVTTAGVVGEVIKLVSPGVLAFASAAAAGLNAVIDDLSPALGGNLETNDKSIFFTGLIPAAPRATLSSTATGFKIQTTLDLILNAGDDIKWPTSIGVPGQVLKTDGIDSLTFANEAGGLQAVVDDLTPDLGGDLATLANVILVGGTRVAPVGRIRQSGADFAIERSGAARLLIDGGTWPLDTGSIGEVLTAQGDGTYEFDAPVTGGITELFEDKTPQLGGPLDTFAQPILIDDVGKISKRGLDFLVEIQGTAPLIFKGGTDPSSELQWPTADGPALFCLVTNGAGKLSFAFRVANVVDDTNPSLGGDLKLNTFKATELTEGELGFIGGSWVFAGLNATGTTEISQVTATTPAKMTISGTLNRFTFDAGLVDFLGNTVFQNEVALNFGGFTEAKVQATGSNAVALTGEPGTTVSVLSDTALKLKGGAIEYTWVDQDGAAGDVMTTDGNGVLSMLPPGAITVQGSGYVDVTDPPSPYTALSANNDQATNNVTFLKEMLGVAGFQPIERPLMFPKGRYQLNDKIVLNRQATPSINGPAITVKNDEFAGFNVNSMQFTWTGPTDRPMFEDRGIGTSFNNILFFGKFNDAAADNTRCAAAYQCFRIATDPFAAGKASHYNCNFEEFDTAMIAGHNGTLDENGDQVTWNGQTNIRGCRQGFMSLKSQNLGWEWNAIRASVEEVVMNVIAGGSFRVKSGLMISNNAIWLRLDGSNGNGIGSSNGIYRMENLEQDGLVSAANVVWLEDVMDVNGQTGNHVVLFSGLRFFGSGTNYMRISGNGALILDKCFNTFTLHDRMFLDARSPRTCFQTSAACDEFLIEGSVDTFSNLWPGSGRFEIGSTLARRAAGLDLGSVRNRAADSTAASRTTWDAITAINKYNTGVGEGILGYP